MPGSGSCFGAAAGSHAQDPKVGRALIPMDVEGKLIQLVPLVVARCGSSVTLFGTCKKQDWRKTLTPPNPSSSVGWDLPKQHTRHTCKWPPCMLVENHILPLEFWGVLAPLEFWGVLAPTGRRYQKAARMVPSSRCMRRRMPHKWFWSV